jgi:hypothetical protein
LADLALRSPSTWLPVAARWAQPEMRPPRWVVVMRWA